MNDSTPTPNDPNKPVPSPNPVGPVPLHVAVSPRTIQLIESAMELMAVARRAHGYLNAALESIDADIGAARVRAAGNYDHDSRANHPTAGTARSTSKPWLN